jgi:3-oxoacyl-[acyl-carrier protein] reductase
MQLTHNPRVALVTGAGRGIGKAIAERLASHGHTVLCVSKSETCVAVANDIVAKGWKAKAFQVDVSDAAAVAKACEQINAELDRKSVV